MCVWRSYELQECLATQVAEKALPQGLKPVCLLTTVARLNRLRKKSIGGRNLTSAAKANVTNKELIVALKRCATQKQALNRRFPQPVKPCPSRSALPRERVLKERLLDQSF